MNIEYTIRLIRIAHEGQQDLSGKPFYLHPVAVMNLLPSDATEVEKVAALLHDVVEDTSFTLESLRAYGYPQELLDILDILTRRENETYLQYIERIRNSGNKSAIRVKLADLSHNSDYTRLCEIEDLEARENMISMATKRYARAKEILLSA